MSKVQMPLCHYPTTVVLVDDNQKFLTSFSQNLTQKGVSNIAFSEPDEALLYVEGIADKSTLNERCYAKEEDTVVDSNIQVTIDLKSLYQHIYNPNRFKELSVLVVDYSMPQMKGDMFFNTISNHVLKRMLLTGKAEQQLAITLLNKKIIDTFSEKKSLDNDVAVVTQVHELQQGYFNDFTERFRMYDFQKTSYVFKKDYASLVEGIINQYSIVEHYTFSIFGSKLLLDSDAKTFFLIIVNEETMDGFCDTARFSDCSDELINKLETKMFVPFLFDEREIDLVPAMWLNYLVPVKQKILNGQKIWYGLCQADKLSSQGHVVSYSEFLKIKEKPLYMHQHC